MAFAGYLLKFGSVQFPNRLLVPSSYKITPNQRLDLEPYRDANMLLHRNTSVNYKTKIDFTSRGNLKYSDKVQMFNIFNNSLVNAIEKKYYIEYWNDETDSYSTGYFYMPDVDFTINRIVDNSLVYDGVRIAFIEY